MWLLEGNFQGDIDRILVSDLPRTYRDAIEVAGSSMLSISGLTRFASSKVHKMTGLAKRNFLAIKHATHLDPLKHLKHK